jgi:uncharacterized membrane protein
VSARDRSARLRFAESTVEPRRNLISGVLVGAAVAGFADEAVFHQLLHWHHFYDKSTPAWGLVSDGLFHVGTFFAIVGGLFLFAELRRRDAFERVRWQAGFLLGLGGFQLYDGTIQHKWWRLHQIRYHVAVWPYDAAWLALASLVLLAGSVLLWRCRAVEARPS